jgi:hypothetical protein
MTSPGATTAELMERSRPRGRRFGVADLMISIFGIALLLTCGTREFASLFSQFSYLCRSIAAYFGFISWGPPQLLTAQMANYGSSVVWHGLQASEWLLLIATPIFLLMRLVRPRPHLFDLWRQPGTMAGLAVAVGSGLVSGWIHHLFIGLNPRTVTPIAVGVTVALAWAGLALSRRWEAEPSWIDRMGRLIGVAAIAVGLISFVKFGV